METSLKPPTGTAAARQESSISLGLTMTQAGKDISALTMEGNSGRKAREYADQAMVNMTGPWESSICWGSGTCWISWTRKRNDEVWTSRWEA